MEWLDALKLQWAWGADEALLDTPQDRRHTLAVSPAPPTVLAKPKKAIARPPTMLTLAESSAGAARLAASCASLAELEDAMRNFDGCALNQTATQLVFADGAENAQIMIIGEAPGGEEDLAGKPFVGPAGQLLDQMLGSIGMDRTMVRFANTVPWRPPGNRAPTETEVALCLPFLYRHIALIAPLGLVALGAVAAKALIGPQAQIGIRRLRGQWHQATIEGLPNPLACLPSYHPAYLIRTPTAKKDSWQDMMSLRAWLNDIAEPVKIN